MPRLRVKKGCFSGAQPSCRVNTHYTLDVNAYSRRDASLAGGCCNARYAPTPKPYPHGQEPPSSSSSSSSFHVNNRGKNMALACHARRCTILPVLFLDQIHARHRHRRLSCLFRASLGGRRVQREHVRGLLFGQRSGWSGHLASGQREKRVRCEVRQKCSPEQPGLRGDLAGERTQTGKHGERKRVINWFFLFSDGNETSVVG